ncbi:MAG: gamma-glutamyltransferase [Oscillospiraceae bacterium]|nr:gamma-glutamyltransferase [Oscillospiraceae bacterium]
MKKYIALLLALVMALSVVACGGAASSAPASSEPEATAEPTAEPAAEPELVPGVDYIEPVWYSTDEDGNTKRDERTATGENGVVTSANVYATQAGIEILEQGGNAVDAAIAVSYALGVAEPQASGLGGGGFMLIHTADGTDTFIDYREVAPANQDAYTWLNEDGTVKDNGTANSRGALAIGVPGEVAGMEYARENYGSGNVTREDIMAPAIELAETGYLVTTYMNGQIMDHYDDLVKYETIGGYYLREDGLPYENGDVLKNPDLAKSLKIVAEQGVDAIYSEDGELGNAIIDEIQKLGGVMTMDDLLNYKVNEREPVTGEYRGYQIISCPPPSSGGTHIVQILNVLENFDVASMEINSSEYIHLFSETFKAAFADRAAYMGDTDFVDVPLDGLTSKDYAKTIADKITDQAQKWTAGDPWVHGHDSTTSFSVADKAGNIVTVTQTIECSFGSAVAIPGYGFIMNDQMHDFSTDPESVNSVTGGKHPLSSMSPTVILNEDGTPFMTLGTPGGTRIFPTVAQVISRVIDHGMDLQTAIDTARIYDNGTDSGVNIESLAGEYNITAETIAELEAMGHTVSDQGEWAMYFGGVQGAQYQEDGSILGCADPRRDGKALAF